MRSFGAGRAARRRQLGRVPLTCLAVGVAAVLAGCTDDAGGRGGSGDRGPTEETSPRLEAVPADCDSTAPPERLVPEIIDERPHDPEAFTQGLLLLGGALYESTGLEGRSSVRELDPLTGEVVRRSELDPSSFGEGLTDLGAERLIQLTWKEGRALIWDRSNLRPDGEHRYEGEGWGITTLDDDSLVMSDGTDSLTIRDPQDFAPRERWRVTRVDGGADRLNELDWDGERIWANRWQTDEILRIDRRCRRVDGVVDASDLTRRAARLATSPIDVLNGIAHVEGTDRFFVTGKLWPVLFEVRFTPDSKG